MQCGDDIGLGGFFRRVSGGPSGRGIEGAGGGGGLGVWGGVPQGAGWGGEGWRHKILMRGKDRILQKLLGRNRGEWHPFIPDPSQTVGDVESLAFQGLPTRST